jgi:sugar phosphate permease
MIDRMGSRKVIFIGGALLLAGLGGLGVSSRLWQLYLTVGLLVGIGVSMTHFLMTQATARKWFTRKAGFVGGVLTSAFWFGSALLSPLLTTCSGLLGWRATALLYALSGFVIMLVAALVIRDKPENLGLHPDGEENPGGSVEAVHSSMRDSAWGVKEALGTLTFWMMFSAYCLLGIPSQGLFGHVILCVALSRPVSKKSG